MPKKLSELKGSLKGANIDRIRRQDKEAEAARERKLMEIVDRARKQREE